MIVRSLMAAVFAGLVAGAFITPVQQVKVVPLILAAEVYESGGEASEPHHHHSALPIATPAHAHSGADGDTSAAGRTGGSLLANLVLGAGFALVLMSASLVLGRTVSVRNGALWGLAGFATVSLAPALGLPPELPAMPAGDLAARQLWWIMTAGATAAGLALLVFKPTTPARLGGLALLVAPHLVPAPHPADLASPIPPTLAAEFAVASLATSALFWVAIGLALGFALDRQRREAALRA